MKKFSKTGLILVGSMLVCLILFLAVGMPSGFLSGGGQTGDLDDKDTPKIQDVLKGDTPLLIFDKSEGAKALMNAYDNGKIIRVNLLCDQGGGNPEIVSEDADVIRQAYKATKNITVQGKSNESVTDSYHHVYFTLEDGYEIGYYFEGEGILVYTEEKGHKARYSIAGSRALWELYRELSQSE